MKSAQSDLRAQEFLSMSANLTTKMDWRRLVENEPPTLPSLEAELLLRWLEAPYEPGRFLNWLVPDLKLAFAPLRFSPSRRLPQFITALTAQRLRAREAAAGPNGFCAKLGAHQAAKHIDSLLLEIERLKGVKNPSISVDR